MSKNVNKKNELQVNGSGAFTPYSDIESPTKLNKLGSKFLSSSLRHLKNTKTGS